MSWLGITVDEIVNMYSKTSESDLGGQLAIEEALDAHLDLVLSTISESVLNRLIAPPFELIIISAEDQQVEAQLGLSPVIENSVRLYKVSQTIVSANPCNPEALKTDLKEITVNSVNTETGEVTFDPLNEGDRVYACYRVNIDEVTIGSIGRVIRYGVAYELGSRVFAVSEDAWNLVDEYKHIWEKGLETLKSKTFVPKELRTLMWLEGLNTTDNMRVFRLERAG